ncbi:S26 family signal peptidase [Methanogenium sp. S4BF]|uniref:S26 family signal peptidase n=1 Tax=Methanogenium sp. S4BF TaxID=1789226 RepID=UPI0024174249|nr:S26 family signal peptidase [Methanogenium sp. S4BF]WFN34147.1 S26 family signal peptidase [Methanogenium sp. S4BF]
MKEKRGSLDGGHTVASDSNCEDSKKRKLRDNPLLLGGLVIVALILIVLPLILLFIVCGTWPAIVAMESESMAPNMNVGDLVFVVAPDRNGDITSWEEGHETGYARFAEYPDLQGNMVCGDVILYYPNGDTSVHPIIHRALFWYDNTTTPGYITKGDNNPTVDQDAYYQGVGAIQPVKDEWIIGKAVFSIPYLGYLSF